MDRQYTTPWYLKAQLEVKTDKTADAAQSVLQALSGDPAMPAEMAQTLRAFAQENGLRI